MFELTTLSRADPTVSCLNDPAADLRRLHGLLKGGGLLVFNTPDVDSYLAKLHGRWWRNFEPPNHVVYVSAKTASMLLDKTGFRPIVNTVALPRERLLKKMGVFELLTRMRFSDKLLLFAKRC